jgi:SMI1/KNR4 family protein SUKH-1
VAGCTRLVEAFLQSIPDYPRLTKLMFLALFEEAYEQLRLCGLHPGIIQGAPIVETDLDKLDRETDFPMPQELRQFLLELGNGFAFVPDSKKDLIGWERIHLADYRTCNIGFGNNVEEEALREISGSNPVADPNLLRHEAEIRKQWIPFYGFAGGGDYLCLDSSKCPATVRFYASQVWPRTPDTWNFTLADSFSDFVKQWSRFHFISPSEGWTTFCYGRSGQFTWEPRHFPQIELLRRSRS